MGIVIRRARVTCRICGAVGNVMGSPELIEQACDEWAIGGHDCADAEEGKWPCMCDGGGSISHEHDHPTCTGGHVPDCFADNRGGK